MKWPNRQIITKVGLLVVMLFVVNTVYNLFFYKNQLKENGSDLLLDLKEGAEDADVLYLGESSNFTVHPNDSDKRSISEMIADKFPNKKFLSICKGAYHAGMFHKLIKQIPKKSSIKTVVVTLNLRTLNQATIHGEIETALQKQGVFYEKRPHLLNRFLLTLNHYDDKTEEERDKAKWHDWTYDTLRLEGAQFPATTIKEWCLLPKFVNEDGTENLKKRQLADHYVKAYAFKVDEKNIRIKQFDNIVKTCKKKKYKLIFNLLAENVAYADSLIGQPLVKLMYWNKNFIKNRYEKQGIVVVDNFDLVEGENYIDQHWTTEHYDEVGRRTVADNVVSKMLK